MPTSYPSGYDTETASSLGADKTNKDPIVDETYDISAPQWNNVKSGVRQIELKLGDGSAVLSRDGDADEGNVREILDFLTWRGDRSGVYEHFLFNAWSTAIMEDVGAVGAFADVTGGDGVGQITAAAGVATGFNQTAQHFHQRYGRFLCRFQISALSATNADVIELGLVRDATHKVVFRSTRAGGAWPDWTVEVNDGGSTDSTVLTGSNPGDCVTDWHLFEILTTTVGAYFYVDRLGAGSNTEYYSYLSGQAPENGRCAPSILWTSNVGGETLSVDVIGAQSTRSIYT